MKKYLFLLIILLSARLLSAQVYDDRYEKYQLTNVSNGNQTGYVFDVINFTVHFHQTMASPTTYRLEADVGFSLKIKGYWYKGKFYKNSGDYLSVFGEPAGMRIKLTLSNGFTKEEIAGPYFANYEVAYNYKKVIDLSTLSVKKISVSHFTDSSAEYAIQWHIDHNK
ncbi:MAG: hypothetical protein JXR71_06820 [Bacteroidales bacterium]|nr:hypothetical protein [Bacteroidales bacterium]